MNPIVCLLIDDDAEEAEIFHYALEELDLPVKCYAVTRGREAVSMLANNQLRPSFIFLDLNMPRMDGKQCLKEIRNIKSTENIPVILYSTSFLEGQKFELESLGATDFIIKTTSIFDLYSELNRIFSKKYGLESPDVPGFIVNEPTHFELSKS